LYKHLLLLVLRGVSPISCFSASSLKLRFFYGVYVLCVLLSLLSYLKSIRNNKALARMRLHSTCTYTKGTIRGIALMSGWNSHYIVCVCACVRACMHAVPETIWVSINYKNFLYTQVWLIIIMLTFPPTVFPILYNLSLSPLSPFPVFPSPVPYRLKSFRSTWDIR